MSFVSQAVAVQGGALVYVTDSPHHNTSFVICTGAVKEGLAYGRGL